MTSCSGCSQGQIGNNTPKIAYVDVIRYKHHEKYVEEAEEIQYLSSKHKYKCLGVLFC